MFKFEKLEVWQKAVGFADCIYETTKTFPSEERFGLMSQMRRAAISVASNIAEGSSRSSETDFARFVEIAYGSLLESVSELEIAKRQHFLTIEDFTTTYARAEELAKMLSALRRSLKDGS
jgi:four helix bundle protein